MLIFCWLIVVGIKLVEYGEDDDEDEDEDEDNDDDDDDDDEVICFCFLFFVSFFLLFSPAFISGKDARSISSLLAIASSNLLYPRCDQWSGTHEIACSSSNTAA
jgi:hypothetical protein